MRIVMIDNYDSFTFNLAHLFYEFDLEVLVYRNDRITLDQIQKAGPDWICISPGPRDPAHAGISADVVRRFGPSVPILGVCLGMQVMNEVFGGRTVRAPLPVHGKRCRVHHQGEGVFAGIPSPFWAARYHSLRIELSSPFILPTAVAEDDVLMGIRHRSWPLCGVQFHPESFMSEYGLELVENFLALHPAWQKERGHDAIKDRFPRARIADSRSAEYSERVEARR
jgi:anthranilate synthase component 2